MTPPQPASASPEISNLMPPMEPHTWLVQCDGENQIFVTATPKSSSSGYKIQKRSILELRNKKVIVCCQDGWALLSDEATPHNYTLWNPSTLQPIVVPPLKLNRDFLVGSATILSSPPDTTSSTLLLVEDYKPNIMLLRIGQGHEKWTEVQCGEQLVPFNPFQDRDELLNCSVCCNGQVYMTTCYGRYLMKVDIVDTTTTTKIVMTPFAKLPCMRTKALSSTTCLLESVGQVFLVYLLFGGLNHSIIAIEVHKLDIGRKQWDKARKIEDRGFFLWFPYSLSWTTELDRGGLYFGDDCYNMDNKCRSVAPCSSWEDLPASSSTFVVPNNHWICEHESKGKDASSDQEAPEQMKINYTKDSSSVERNLGDLHESVIGQISYHLTNFLDYINFRSVSRVFSSAAPATEWRKTLVSTSSEKHPWPWLMICSDSKQEYTFIDPRFSGRYFMRIPEELADTTLHCAKDGWLLMSRDDHSMLFFNPFKKAILTCPPHSLEHHQDISYIMSSAPTCSNNLLMAVTAEEPGVRAYNIGNGDEEWQYVEFETENDFVPIHNSPVQTDDGYYYFLGQKGNILILRRREDGFWIYDVSHELEALCQSSCDIFLVERNEYVYAIFVGDQGKWVRVFMSKYEGDGEPSIIWSEVESIGKRTMFLSRSSCLSVEAEYEEMGERIYFPRLHKGTLVFYSLKTGKFHSCNGDETLMDYADTTELFLCFWTESRWN